MSVNVQKALIGVVVGPLHPADAHTSPLIAVR